MIVKNNKKIDNAILKNGKKELLSRDDILLTLDNIVDLIIELNLDRYYMLINELDINHSFDNTNIVHQIDCIIEKLKIIEKLFHNKIRQESTIKE